MSKTLDPRPAKGRWAPGGFSIICRQCGDTFLGGMKAANCAPCTYMDYTTDSQLAVQMKKIKKLKDQLEAVENEVLSIRVVLELGLNRKDVDVSDRRRITDAIKHLDELDAILREED